MALTVRIQKHYGDFLLDVDFTAEDGQVLALLGASGCGKSVTLKCIAGIDKPDRGRIELDGRVLFDSGAGINLPPQARQVGLLFQNYALFPHMTVARNVAVCLGPMDKRRRQARTVELLALLHLEDQGPLYPRQLSGGQQQRAALARILASEPRALLLDEPFSALDALTKRELHQWYLDMMDQLDMAVLFITHDIDEAVLLSDRVCILSGRPGRITAEVAIQPPRPRGLDFAVSGEFLAYKKRLLSLLGT